MNRDAVKSWTRVAQPVRQGLLMHVIGAPRPGRSSCNGKDGADGENLCSIEKVFSGTRVYFILTAYPEAYTGDCMPSLLDDIRAQKTEVSQFAYLGQMLAGWFGQDYLIDSDDFRILIQFYRRDVSKADTQQTVQDIDRFLERYGTDNETVRLAMDRVFYPCITVEGWDGLTTREWLLKVKESLLARAQVAEDQHHA